MTILVLRTYKTHTWHKGEHYFRTVFQGEIIFGQIMELGPEETVVEFAGAELYLKNESFAILL